MVARYGGNDASEAAVAAALKWFADHQNPDGSWSYDHRTGPCQGRCADAGSLTDCKTGATAMALLPFLGAGQTHKQGTYKKNVKRGLYFLTSQMKVQTAGRPASRRPGPGRRQHVLARPVVDRALRSLCDDAGPRPDGARPACRSTTSCGPRTRSAAAGAMLRARRATPRSSAGSSWPSRAVTWPT